MRKSIYARKELGVAVVEKSSSVLRVKNVYGTSFLSSSCLSNSEIKDYLTHVKAQKAQLVAYRLGTGEVPGSNPSKGKFIHLKSPSTLSWCYYQILYFGKIK